MIRETTLSVYGVGERVVRTEAGGKVKTVAQLDKEHFKRVKAALIEMRRAALPDTMPDEMKDKMTRRLPRHEDNWARVTRKSRPVPTVDPTTYLREESPGHWVQD